MRSPTRARGRRGAVWGASAAAVVVGAAGLLAGCGGDGHGGDYVAIGAAGGPAPPGTRAGGSTDPTGGVRLVPLDGESNSPEGQPDPAAAARDATGATPKADSTATPGVPEPGSLHTASSSPAEGGSDGRTPSASPAPAPTATAPSGSASAGPAALAVGDPVRAGTDQRWCEDVTLVLHNSGGTAVRSGTVTFGTHVVDALGIDWATRASTAPLPTPIAAGAREEKTWTVCVDAMGVPPLERSREWGSVPLGMHIETRDVSVRWE